MLKFDGFTKKPRFINPPNLLKKKVGSGGIDQAYIENAERIIATSKLDFIPYAEQFLKELNTALKAVSKAEKSFDEARDDIIKPVMQLKAGGGMFGYELITHVSDILLEYLDTIREINDDTQTIFNAHENALRVIIKNKLKGDGGAEGYKLANELERACLRYFNKYIVESE